MVLSLISKPGTAKDLQHQLLCQCVISDNLSCPVRLLKITYCHSFGVTPLLYVDINNGCGLSFLVRCSIQLPRSDFGNIFRMAIPWLNKIYLFSLECLYLSERLVNKKNICMLGYFDTRLLLLQPARQHLTE